MKHQASRKKNALAMTSPEHFCFLSDIKIKLTQPWVLQNVKRKTISTKRLEKYQNKTFDVRKMFD